MPSLADLSPGAPAPQPDVPPQIAGLLSGEMPAASLPPLDPKTPDPLQAFVLQNVPTLRKAGLDFYEAKDLSTVIFNPQTVPEAKIAAADKAGKLAEVAPMLSADAPEARPEDTSSAEPTPQTVPPPAAAPAPRGPVPPTLLPATGLRGLKPSSPIAPNPVPTQLARRARL